MLSQGSGSDSPEPAHPPGLELFPYHYSNTGRKHQEQLARALSIADDISRISPKFLKQARSQERAYAVQEFRDAVLAGVSPISPGALKQHQDDLLAAMPGFQERRRVELAFADRLEQCSYETTDFLLAEQVRRDVSKMRDCRQGGYSGIDRVSGKRRQIWDEKCGKVRLCPDESRAETQRMVSRYVPHLYSWLKGHGRRRAFYCVFTEPNFAPGQLAREKKGQIERFKAKIVKGRRDCTDLDRERFGYSNAKKYVELFPQVKGSLLIQEDPLSAGQDWNVHLNVILLVEGAIDYADIREAWGHNVEIRELDGEVKNLTSTFLEIIKYAAQFTASKSHSKKDRGLSSAPGLLTWPLALLLEWYSAQQGFRRSRSYGELYRLPGDPVELDPVESETQWITRIEWSDAGRYIVDLILENNFLENNPPNMAILLKTGPPGPGG